jgi:phytoene synthase
MGELATRRGVSLTAARQLLQGMRSDLETVRVPTDGALVRYCYLAAGTVGLMMCPVIGVREQHALAHAVDLGIAMQLTNICRDVLEDAGINRVYIPESRLQAAGTESEAVVRGEAPAQAVASVVEALLELADRYYKSGHAGLRYIPWRPRFAITIASRLYRQIGLRLRRKHGSNALHGRTIVPPHVKVWCVFKAVGSWVVTLFQRRGASRHDPELHHHLEGLYPPQEAASSVLQRN